MNGGAGSLKSSIETRRITVGYSGHLTAVAELRPNFLGCALRANRGDIVCVSCSSARSAPKDSPADSTICAGDDYLHADAEIIRPHEKCELRRLPAFSTADTFGLWP